MLPVRQHFPDHSIPDVRGEVLRQLGARQFASRVPAGARIAIRRRQPRHFQYRHHHARGRGLLEIARLPAVHLSRPWAATAAQPPKAKPMCWRTYGIHAATMGCPVVSSLDVVPTGRTPDGIETFMDRSAFESDGVMLIGRVKWHTDFSGKLESGLFKMTAIGLGKFAGAQRYHTYAYKLGLEHVIRTVGRQVLTSGKIIGGLAILEDANHNTGRMPRCPPKKWSGLMRSCCSRSAAGWAAFPCRWTF